jgi:multicomponent Na+:H+ antiporter subunit E
MTFFLANLLLALLWASLQLFRPFDLITGFILGYLLLWLTRNWLGPGAGRYARRVPTFVWFLAYYFKELVLSTWEVTVALFSDQSTLKPGIIAFPLEAKTDLEIVLLNNLLIFTPGTLGVHLSPDRSTLYVHIIDVDDVEAACAKIKTGLERRLLEVLR